MRRAIGRRKGNRRAPAAKEKEERGRTGIDRESKVTNAKVIVLLSHLVERIYRVPRDDTLAFPRLEAVEAKKAKKTPWKKRDGDHSSSILVAPN